MFPQLFDCKYINFSFNQNKNKRINLIISSPYQLFGFPATLRLTAKELRRAQYYGLTLECFGPKYSSIKA